MYDGNIKPVHVELLLKQVNGTIHAALLITNY